MCEGITNMGKRKINIIIADDNREFCNILNYYLSTQMDIVVTGIAENGVEALKLIKKKSLT
jgi:two-component system response regulator (stage 0 sporulation protein A)